MARPRRCAPSCSTATALRCHGGDRPAAGALTLAGARGNQLTVGRSGRARASSLPSAETGARKWNRLSLASLTPCIIYIIVSPRHVPAWPPGCRAAFLGHHWDGHGRFQKALRIFMFVPLVVGAGASPKFGGVCPSSRDVLKLQAATSAQRAMQIFVKARLHSHPPACSQPHSGLAAVACVRIFRRPLARACVGASQHTPGSAAHRAALRAHRAARTDADGQDDHPRGRGLGHHRERQSQDSGQGGHPARPAA